MLLRDWADLDEDRRRRGLGVLLRVHLDLAGEAVALAAVAGRAGGDDVLPDRFAAAAAGDDVVDGEAGLLEPQYWQVQASRASTALRVILRRWASRGTRT